MRVRWTPPARVDLRRQIHFIAVDSQAAARQMAQQVRSAVAVLADHPLLGRPGRVLDTREFVITRTPFTIAYRVRANVVEVVGILHQAQQRPGSFNRADDPRSSM